MSTKPGTIWRERLLARYYYGRPGWSDGTTQFHALVGQFAKPGCRILELGAGPDNPTTAFLAQQGVVTGLDIDPAVKSNHHCRNAYVYDGVHVPLPSNSFDLVVSNYVCEHIEDPPRVCREIHRVLRPGGAYIFRTPNLWHYVSIISRLSPHWLHRLLANKARALAPETHAPYPTYHRMNTRRVCRSVLERQGFSVVRSFCIEPEPSYAMASRVMFYPAMAWERVLNSSWLFESLRANILCVAQAIK